MKKYILLLLSLLISFSGIAQESSHVFVVLNSKPDKEVISEEEQANLQKTHLENIGKMAEEGKLSVAGPFEGGGGIFILNTGDLNLANEWLQTDPAIRAKRWDIDLLPVRFLRGGACLAKEPYEMVTYHYTRIIPINNIANYKTNRSMDDFWLEMSKIEGVIMVGTFKNQDGGVIITDKSLDMNRFAAYTDQVELMNKNLWVAKGSFCEK